jgi:hypothetical protein
MHPPSERAATNGILAHTFPHGSTLVLRGALIFSALAIAAFAAIRRRQ